MRLYIGIYFIYLQDWLKLFPLEHIFILRLEDYAERREENVLKLYKFLSLSKYIRINHEYKGGIEISILKIRACFWHLLTTHDPEGRILLSAQYKNRGLFFLLTIQLHVFI